MVSRIDDKRAMTIGNQMYVNIKITVQSIIPAGNQAEVQYVVQLDITHHSVLDL